MSFALALNEAAIIAFTFWPAYDSLRPVVAYLVDVVSLTVGLTFGNMIGVRAQRKVFPPGLWQQDIVDVRRIVWLGLPVSQPELAPAVIGYSQRLLKYRQHVSLAVMGVLAVAAGVSGYLARPEWVPLGALIVAVALGAAAFALIPHTLRQRKRYAVALKNAQEVLEAGQSRPPALMSAEGDPV
jgi:hypothetical protein